MAERIHKQRPEKNAGEADANPASPATDSARTEKLKAELDDLLDEIDEVLETNAEDFVKSYVQKGGE
jgi:prokaryotic ubiquitin-like protein Pup